jgi:hypothetical protein
LAPNNNVLNTPTPSDQIIRRNLQTNKNQSIAKVIIWSTFYTSSTMTGEAYRLCDMGFCMFKLAVINHHDRACWGSLATVMSSALQI